MYVRVCEFVECVCMCIYVFLFMGVMVRLFMLINPFTCKSERIY